MDEVLPELQPVLLITSNAPPLDFDNIAALREAGSADTLLAMYVPEVHDVTSETVAIDVDGGTIDLRVHRPDGADGAPALVYLHGGGWVVGSAASTDRTCRRLASRAGMVVVSVDYRLAPEHGFPIPLEDCYAALQWVVDNAATLRVDPAAVTIGGGSAGGNLAAGVALMARDRGGPALIAQWLDIPATDLTLPDDASWLAYGKGFGLNRDDVVKTIACYATGDDLTHPYCSPLLAGDLTGLPLAIVTVNGCDPLRDQGERYARALEAAGVPVRFTCWPGHLHGTTSLTTLAPSCQEFEDEVLTGLAEARRLAAPA